MPIISDPNAKPVTPASSDAWLPLSHDGADPAPVAKPAVIPEAAKLPDLTFPADMALTDKVSTAGEREKRILSMIKNIRWKEGSGDLLVSERPTTFERLAQIKTLATGDLEQLQLRVVTAEPGKHHLSMNRAKFDQLAAANGIKPIELNANSLNR